MNFALPLAAARASRSGAGPSFSISAAVSKSGSSGTSLMGLLRPGKHLAAQCIQGAVL